MLINMMVTEKVLWLFVLKYAVTGLKATSLSSLLLLIDLFAMITLIISSVSVGQQRCDKRGIVEVDK